MENFQKLYDRTLRFLSFRPRSEKEIRNYLARSKSRSSRKKVDQVDQNLIKKIVAKLKKLNFINDKEFAKWWIEQRQGSKPRGKRIIIMELKQKGISDLIIQNSEFMIQNELELVKRAALKKIDVYKKLPPMEFRQKLSQFLLRRGFDWEIIKKVIDEVLKK